MQPTLNGQAVPLKGHFPEAGSTAKAATLTNAKLEDKSLDSFSGWRVLNIFPSIDTPTCAASVRRFNELAAKHPDCSVLCISADLPFAQQRFCGAEGLERVHTLSCFRHPQFGEDYGVAIADGPLRGLLARAVIVLDPQGKIVHSEMVARIEDEPDYDAALAHLPH
ncbi:MAG: thiol peroxidase [Acidithiobacillus sp.]|uniref:thiol peroxidase n=1 Tax=Acidithiobacillus sp. TaxID=1872118 RepID=UPI003CFDE329